MPQFVYKNLILACHITGVYDVNRSETLPDDDYALIQNWATSIAYLNLHGIVFHNNFSETTCKKHENKNLKFIKITHDEHYKPNVYRYLVYNNFLKSFGHQIENLFITDISDVVVMNNPFIQTLFLENPMTIFCGDEPKSLSNDWMLVHAEHLRHQIQDYAAYEKKFAKYPLLNCGIVGGNIAVMRSEERRVGKEC